MPEIERIFDAFVDAAHADPIPGSDGIFTSRKKLAVLRRDLIAAHVADKAAEIEKLAQEEDSHE